MYRLIKPLLFRISPETAHTYTMRLFSWLLQVPLVGNMVRRYYTITHPTLKRNVFGLQFNNPVGLAAGFDKDGKYYQTISALGFGFVEIGTVTPRPQAGNPQPRLFRLPPDQALINRMGFNNEGVHALCKRLSEMPPPKNLIIGGNIGKNKDTPNDQAISDYLYCFEQLFPYVHYFVVNVSSPNTPGLRALQEKEPLTALLQTLVAHNNLKPQPKPILLKIAPDLTDTQLDDIIDIVQETNISGIIATNTTIDRSNLNTSAETLDAIGAGGLSGAPLRARSTQVVQYLHRQLGDKTPIIAVGGIHSAADAIEKLEAGASLVQVYTGLIYEGPDLIRRICLKLKTAT